MTAAGVLTARLPADNRLVVTLDHEETRATAARLGTTRSAAAVELWRRFRRRLRAGPVYSWGFSGRTPARVLIAPPDQRLATLLLLQDRKVGLLREALRGPNLEGRVYAADALLYLAGLSRVDLTGSDEEAIRELRQSGAEVRTCGNAGSYKIYLEPVREVLSDSTVTRIPEMYEMLAESGYWKQ
jgi:hypothetical protein